MRKAHFETYRLLCHPGLKGYCGAWTGDVRSRTADVGLLSRPPGSHRGWREPPAAFGRSDAAWLRQLTLSAKPPRYECAAYAVGEVGAETLALEPEHSRLSL
eukprot:4484766-Pleurochrysis_carterae.AAC.7